MGELTKMEDTKRVDTVDRDDEWLEDMFCTGECHTVGRGDCECYPIELQLESGSRRYLHRMTN